MHRERDNLFPDEMFEDLFSAQGRRSVPPSVAATTMVLQRLEGLSDREAVEWHTFDTRWRFAAGVGGYDSGGWGGFAQTVLVDMRERLRCSERPDRIFDVGLSAAKAAGLLGVADPELEAKLRACLKCGDDYATSAKPQIDWDDPAAIFRHRKVLISRASVIFDLA